MIQTIIYAVPQLIALVVYFGICVYDVILKLRQVARRGQVRQTCSVQCQFTVVLIDEIIEFNYRNHQNSVGDCSR
jgi:hypothetical protein